MKTCENGVLRRSSHEINRLHLVEAERILLNPLVPDCIEGEVLQAAEQVDRSVVPAFVPRLHVGCSARR